jgi:EAL domain-containing protein (putative c-di-GMP-specific phosphodiesterase class I)
MADEQNIKEQRDRFLAFSFASSDLFVEVSDEGNITYALGAAKGLTGVEDDTLLGRQWLDLFAKVDRPTLVSLHAKAKPVQRCGPILVTLDKEFGKGRKAVLTAIKMPDSNRFYVTLGFTSVLMARTGEMLKVTEEKDLLDKDTFLRAAQEAMNFARNLNQDIDLTLLDVPEIDEFRQRLGKEGWEDFHNTVGGFLRSRSVDGQSAAEISEGRFSVLHDKEIGAEILAEQLAEIAMQSDPVGNIIEVKSKTVTSELGDLSERDATKALVYTINEFERKGTELTIETLNTGFKAYVSANAQKISQFKSIIKQLHFNMYFQPIVDINNGYEAIHFEMLSRFLDGSSTLEWVMFGEDIGMAPDFDMAVLDRVINYLKYKSSGRRSRFAINISGQSIQNDQFFEKLQEKLASYKEVSERLIFEITESSQIENLQKVGHNIDILREQGHKVCLDDFGAGSASFQYLQALRVDYLKIDGQYTKRILTSDRDAAMVKSLISMCKDLGIKVIAEMVEEEEQLYRLRHIGAEYAQGYLFARPSPKPEYTPPKKFAN